MDVAVRQEAHRISQTKWALQVGEVLVMDGRSLRKTMSREMVEPVAPLVETWKLDHRRDSSDHHRNKAVWLSKLVDSDRQCRSWTRRQVDQELLEPLPEGQPKKYRLDPGQNI